MVRHEITVVERDTSALPPDRQPYRFSYICSCGRPPVGWYSTARWARKCGGHHVRMQAVLANRRAGLTASSEPQIEEHW